MHIKRILHIFIVIFGFYSIPLVYAQPASRSHHEYTQALYAVTMNYQDTQQVALILRDESGNVWINSRIIATWGLKPLNSMPLFYHGNKYYALNRLNNVKYRIDTAKTRLYVTLPPEDFKGSTLVLHRNDFIVPQRSPLGGFLNYDFFAEKEAHQDTETNATAELGVFNNFGVITSETLAKDIGGSDNKTVRLNTTWTIDKPAVMQTIRLGDTYSRPGLWGNSVSMGGIQWARNFSTQPQYRTFPMPSMQGVAKLPSAVDVYINNAKMSTRDIPAGPFDIENIPVVTGQGTVNLVTTDVLGRQQTYSVPYYASAELLKPGLHDFSFEVGSVRHNYGIKSSDYEKVLAVGTDTVGITKKLTGQWHAEWYGSTQALGAGGNYLIDNYGVLTAAMAASHSKDNQYGGLGLLRFSHQGMKINYGFNLKATTSKFKSVGYDSDELPPKLETQVFCGFPFYKYGSFGISYVGRENRDKENERFLTASYNFTLFHKVQGSLSGITNIGGRRNQAIFLTLSVYLGHQTSAYVHATGRKDSNSIVGTVEKSLPAGTGYGYRVEGATGDTKYALVGASYQNNFGTYSAQVAHNDETEYQLQARGGLAFLDKDIFPSRSINRSFAVVTIPGYSGIPVYLENQKVGTTNRRGHAMIPNLNAYELNQISVRPNELPLTAKVEKSAFQVAPYYRSGVLVKLPIYRSTDGIVTLVNVLGKPLPVGSTVKVKGQKQEYLVGYDGQVFLTHLAANNQLIGLYDNQECELTVSYHPSNNPVPDLGTHICRSVH